MFNEDAVPHFVGFQFFVGVSPLLSNCKIIVLRVNNGDNRQLLLQQRLNKQHGFV